MSEEARNYYMGRNTCGCYSAALVDDETTTAKEIADFARSMQKTERKVEHRTWTGDEFMAAFKNCECEVRSNAVFSRPAPEQ